MSKLLEILGRGIEINTAGVMWHWIDTMIRGNPDYEQIDDILNLISLTNYDIAAEKISEYLIEQPECSMGRMAAAALCVEKADLTGALQNLQSVYLRQPNNTIALYVLGHCYERLGKEAQAVEFYQDCLKFKGYLELPRLRLAAIYFKNGQFEKTINEYKEHRLEYPDNIETLVLLGHLYMHNGNYEAAVDAFNNAILVHPDNFTSSMEEDRIKEIIENNGHYQAAEHIRILLEQQPNSAGLYLLLGDILADEGNVPDAIVSYERAIRLQPSFLQGFVKLGSLYLAAGNFTIAAELFNKAAAVNDEIVDAYFGLAQAQKKRGNRDDAYSTLMLGATIQQNSCILFAEAARLRYCAQAHNSADSQNSSSIMFNTLAQQCRLNPDNPSLQYAMGLLLMKKGLFKEAAERFAVVTEKNQTHYRAHSRRVFCYAENGEKDKAVMLLNDENETSSELLGLHYKTSLLYCSRRSFLDALKTTKDRLQENFDSQNTLTTLNEVLQNMGLIDRAFAGWNLISDMADHAFGR
ncbi:MAG: tetratricopeptide repeat protein [Sedimentisphaerales bacterium]|nr:tetratricopeptide repeat protein [Sedimentisphaerales bacterium]